MVRNKRKVPVKDIEGVSCLLLEWFRALDPVVPSLLTVCTMSEAISGIHFSWTVSTNMSIIAT